jgi:predicted ATPase with chaperone activity
MNLCKMTDQRLSALRQKLVQELNRRSKIATHNLDAAAIIYGNEAAKRALVVAAAGNHSILFIGPSNCGKSMMRATALELGLAETFEHRCCPCGNRSDPRANCTCTVRQIERHLDKIPQADMTVEMQRPTHREMGCAGTSLADMRQQIVGMSEYRSTDLGPHEASLMKAAVVETAIDPAAQAIVLAVARTIGNLDNRERIEASHLMEAINYRPLWR